MFDCCAPNCFDYNQCYNTCTSPDCSLTTEFPKQTGPFVEEKFSNFNPPSFLLNRNPPNLKVRTRSCSCFTKSAKVSPNCKCKAKGILDCKKINKESGKRVCDKSCEAKSDNDSEAANGRSGNNNDNDIHGKSSSQSIPHDSNSDNNLGLLAQRQGPDGAWQLEDPVIPVYDFRDELNPMNEMPRPLKEMPAAGLPTRKDPQFDPCTGAECQQTQAPQTGAFEAPANYMYPNSYPSPCCPMPYCPVPCCPCPPGVNMFCPMPLQQNVNFNESGENPLEATKSTSSEKVEKSKDERPKSKKVDATNGKEKDKDKASKSKRQHNHAIKLVKCNEIGKDLIQRICNSLQIPRPPVDCYIVLPIPMAVKSKTKTSPTESKKNSELSSSHDENNTDAPTPQKQSEKEKQPPAAQERCRAPTRNCGCNTMISGKFDESADNSEGSQPNKDKDKDKDKDKEQKKEGGGSGGGGGGGGGVGVGSACCSTGGCYYRPRYKYCYNPCTGCFYWRKQCCCCNGCCGNGGGTSCPIPKQASKSDSGSSSPTDKKKNEATKSKSSMQSKRSKAGAMCTFQPGGQDPYNQWLGFQQHCGSMTRPPFYYRSTRGFPSQFQMNNRRFVSQSHNLNGRQHRSVDIDWSSY